MLAVAVPILLIWGALHMLYGRRSPRFGWVAAPLRRWVHHMKVFIGSVGLISKAKVSALLRSAAGGWPSADFTS